MANTLCEDGLDIGTEGGTRVAAERVVGRVGGRGLADAEDVSPLLDVLPEVLRVQGSITAKWNVIN